MKPLLRLVAVVSMLGCFTLQGRAQTSSGTISGHIVDQSNGIVVNAPGMSLSCTSVSSLTFGVSRLARPDASQNQLTTPEITAIAMVRPNPGEGP